MTRSRRGALKGMVGGCLALGLAAAGFGLTGEPRQADRYVVLGYNDLGMHCMNADFSELMILPPFNTLHAQVIERREEPRLVQSGVTVSYEIIGNTHSSDKTNFWQYLPPAFGDPPPDVGLTGSGLAGLMSPTGQNDWAAVGIPIVPIDDSGRENPYPLANIIVRRNGIEEARTQAVVPVSTEVSCNLCHATPGVSTATDILMAHDRLHGTTLVDRKPVMCAECHADPAVGAPGLPGLSTFSGAMHAAHASRMGEIELENTCYACHPGIRTQCQRDVHLARGVTCADCHGGMEAVGDPARTPWVDEPRCADCHHREEFEFEEPGKLFKESRGHGGVHCMACHGSPHAITPTVTAVDNLQAILRQGHSGVISECIVCHTTTPSEGFEHKRD